MYDARIDATCAYFLELILTLVLCSRLDLGPTRQVSERSSIQKGIETCGLATPEISAMPRILRLSWVHKLDPSLLSGHGIAFLHPHLT